MVALALARLLREAMNAEKGQAQRIAILEIAREFAWLRKQDHQMKQLGREQEIWEQKQAERHEAEIKAMKWQIQGAEIRTQVYGDMLRRDYCERVEAGTLDPERAAKLREIFAKHTKWLRECGVKDLPINGAEPPNPPAKSK